MTSLFRVLAYSWEHSCFINTFSISGLDSKIIIYYNLKQFMKNNSCLCTKKKKKKKSDKIYLSANPKAIFVKKQKDKLTILMIQAQIFDVWKNDSNLKNCC